MSGCRLGFGTNAGFGATVTVCGIHQFAVVNVREPGVVVVIAVTSCPSGSMVTVTFAVGAFVRRTVYVSVAGSYAAVFGLSRTTSVEPLLSSDRKSVV